MDDTAGETPRVCEVRRISLAFRDEPWPYAEAHAQEIRRHWDVRKALNPAFFDGRILIMRAWRLDGGHFEARLSPVDFSAFLYWREQGHPDRSVRDGFGSAILRSREGHVLLGRQGSGGLNAGRAYFPGGFFDLRDVRADGIIDVEASIARELAEETGIGPAELARRPGYYLTVFGSQLSMGVEYSSGLSAEDLARRMRAGIARDAEGELMGVLAVADVAAAEDPSIQPYARTLLRHILETRAQP